MKVVIDTTMERHMLEVSEAGVKDVAKRIMDKMKDDELFIGLYHVEKDKAIILRKSEIMAIFVYPDELCDYDKTTSQMIQDAVLENEKGEENLWIDCGNSYIKMYVDKRGCLVFEPRLKKE